MISEGNNGCDDTDRTIQERSIEAQIIINWFTAGGNTEATYEDLHKATGIKERKRLQCRMGTARRALLREHKIMIGTVRTKGYRVLETDEILHASDGDIAKAHRDYLRGHATLIHGIAGQPEMTPDQRHAYNSHRTVIELGLAVSKPKAQRTIGEKVKEVGEALPLGRTLELFE